MIPSNRSRNLGRSREWQGGWILCSRLSEVVNRGVSEVLHDDWNKVLCSELIEILGGTWLCSVQRLQLWNSGCHVCAYEI